MPSILSNDRVWIKNRPEAGDRRKGHVLHVNNNQTEAVVRLEENNVAVRVGIEYLELRETHE